MVNNYQIFADSYHKLLELVEQVDQEVVSGYQKIVSKLPSKVFELTSENKIFSHKENSYKVTLDRYDDMIEFEYVVNGKDKPFVVTIYAYPFYEDELLEEYHEENEEDFETENIPTGDLDLDDNENEMMIFSLTVSNTLTAPQTKLNVEIIDGKWQLKGVQGDDLEIDYAVFVKRRDDEYFLISKKSVNECEMYRKEVPITYEELLEYTISDVKNAYADDEDEDEFDYDGFNYAEYANDLPYEGYKSESEEDYEESEDCDDCDDEKTTNLD